MHQLVRFRPSAKAVSSATAIAMVAAVSIGFLARSSATVAHRPVKQALSINQVLPVKQALAVDAPVPVKPAAAAPIAKTPNSTVPKAAAPKAAAPKAAAPKKRVPSKKAPKKAAPARPVPEPATPAGLPAGIEPLPSYVPQTACEAGFRPGTEALGKLLVKTYPGTRFVGDYACGTDGLISEHYEGRALDWMNSARIPAQAARSAAVLAWLLGTDKAGHKYAMARRLGVMYVIWNNFIWSADVQRWDPYLNCASTPQVSLDSLCHRNHMHISLSWDGAWGRTSFYSLHVYTATDYGPCRAKDLNWAAPYSGPNPTRCPSYPKLTAPAGASPVLAALINWSGDVITRGSKGPAVMAVQAALGVNTNSVFDPTTARAVAQFQRSHRLKVDAIINAATWRALVAAAAKPAPTKPAPTKPALTKPTKPTTKPHGVVAPAPVKPKRVTTIAPLWPSTPGVVTAVTSF